MAYNLISLLRHFTLNQHKTATLKTLKSYCFALGACTSNHANKKVLKIALPAKRRPWMEQVFENIRRLDHNHQPPYA